MKRTLVLFSPILNIVLGVLCIIFKGNVLKWAAMAIGLYIAVYSIILLFSYKNKKIDNIFYAYIISLVIGILIILFSAFIVNVIRIVAGIVFIIMGVFNLFKLLNNSNNKLDVCLVISSIFFIIIGSLIFIDHGVLYYIIGAMLIVNGLLDIIRSTTFKKNNKSNVIDAEVNDL